MSETDVTAEELLAAAIETACTAERARTAVLEMRSAADAFADAPPDNETEIRKVAVAFGIPVRHRQIRHIVMNLTDVLLDELANPGLRPSKTVGAYASERELRDWERRDVLPHGAYHEAAQAALIAREHPDDADALAHQLERCQLALAYPVAYALRICGK